MKGCTDWKKAWKGKIGGSKGENKGNKDKRTLVKALDMDLQKGVLEKKSLDDETAAVGGKPVSYLNLEFGFVKNGKYAVLEGSEKAVFYAVQAFDGSGSRKLFILIPSFSKKYVNQSDFILKI